MSVPIVTLITDFGTKDPFVGQMKGVMLSINPRIVIVDVTHQIPPFDVRKAAFVVSESFGYFPRGTIHVAVVDPGVGSARRPIIVAAQGHLFVGPDNGIFSLIIDADDNYKVIKIENVKFFFPERGSTFHARDVFAPVAAWLAKGIPVEDFGPPVADPVTLNIDIPLILSNSIKGRVVYIDRFGNCITNIHKRMLPREDMSTQWEVLWRNRTVELVSHYEAASKGDIFALFNSSGYLELFVFMGNCAAEWNFLCGDEVELVFRSK
ncbi:MAG: SAM-dependent chlorinase/fluorinase [Syntrophales bacterium]|nr:SAM-dependent chlorinase/fluorinase [Syntrophales bacterium]